MQRRSRRRKPFPLRTLLRDLVLQNQLLSLGSYHLPLCFLCSLFLVTKPSPTSPHPHPHLIITSLHLTSPQQRKGGISYPNFLCRIRHDSKLLSLIYLNMSLFLIHLCILTMIMFLRTVKFICLLCGLNREGCRLISRARQTRMR